jgi:hypothetical protein
MGPANTASAKSSVSAQNIVSAEITVSAETYLRELAERELRRWERGDPHQPTRPYLDRFTAAASTLIRAGVIDAQAAPGIAAELKIAFALRSGAHQDATEHLFNQLTRAVRTPSTDKFPPADGPLPVEPAEPVEPVEQPLLVPLGQALHVDDERAPCDLHLLAYLRTEENALISLVIAMRWPADGSSTDLEIQGAGPHHLPYRLLELADAHDTRYRLSFLGDGGTSAWQGVATITPSPPADSTGFDLIADGSHRLAHLDLARLPPPARISTGQVTESRGERMLIVGAERILAGLDRGWEPAMVQQLAWDAAVLAEAGLIAPDSPVPGRLVALYDRLGITDHGIAAPPAPIPARWASILTATLADRSLAGRAEPLADRVVPLAVRLPVLDGLRFSVTGLVTVADQSILHVAVTGPIPGHILSWWVKGPAGEWHVANWIPGGPTVHALRLTPPLTAADGEIELVVTGSTARVHVTVPLSPMDNF